MYESEAHSADSRCGLAKTVKVRYLDSEEQWQCFFFPLKLRVLVAFPEMVDVGGPP